MRQTLAVIVPAFNAAATLDVCLSAINRSSRRPDELIVFCDGATDRTEEIARSHGARIIVNQGKPLGPAEGRNRSSCETDTDLLVFIDADVEVHPDAIVRLEAEISSAPDIAAAFGSYDDLPRCNRLSALYVNLRHHFVHQNADPEAGTFWAGLGIVRHAAFDAAGGFDARFQRPSIEDIELGIRLKQMDGRVRIVPVAQAKHWKNWTLAELWRTDIFRRAAPWSKLIVAGKTPGAGLNASAREKLCSSLAHSIWLLCAICVFAPKFLPALAALSAIYLALNARFYRLLFRRGGFTLLLAGIGLHFLYHLYASAVFGLVLLESLIQRVLAPSPRRAVP